MDALDDAPLAAAGSESEAGTSRGVAGPTASISRQRWMSEDARGPEGGSSSGAAAREEEGDASKAAAGVRAGRNSSSSARRGAAHRSRICRRGVGANSAGEGGGCSCWCGGGVMLKNGQAAGVGFLHEADSWGMAATDEAMAVAVEMSRE
jgi:hypothetical protein